MPQVVSSGKECTDGQWRLRKYHIIDGLECTMAESAYKLGCPKIVYKNASIGSRSCKEVHLICNIDCCNHAAMIIDLSQLDPGALVVGGFE